MPYSVPVRMCAGCSKFHLGDDRNEAYFCPACAAKQEPHPTTVGSIVSIPPSRGRGRYVVLSRDGDMAEVRALGFPDAASIHVHAGATRPENFGAFQGAWVPPCQP